MAGTFAEKNQDVVIWGLCRGGRIAGGVLI
jgi:hypothetical protein